MADSSRRSISTPVRGRIAEGTIPARGVIEVKATSEDAWVVADGPQVTRYWGKYRQVLVTNYRDFVLVGQDIEGKPTKLETYRLAPNEMQFWKAANLPKKTAERLAPSFEEFLKRVLLSTATLASPQDVAWFLASYAREAKFRTDEGHLPALASNSHGAGRSAGHEIRHVSAASISSAPHSFRRSFTECFLPGYCGARAIRPPTRRRGLIGVSRTITARADHPQAFP